MKILVQKFGGTSVASEESREHVYKKIEKAVNEGYALVVVVSAMGRNGDPYATDTLLNLIRKDFPSASKRELDMIFSCGENISGSIIASNLQKRGYNSIYLTGEQARIITDENHSDAKIIKVENERIMSLLSQGNIVVVGGGQGVSENGEITTLGRGGSDTTGCALGVALDADEIHIYTDVEGIMTADPRKVKDAGLLDEISYEDCCNMASMGAKVIHPRAVEVASRKPHIKLYIKSTFSNKKGTLVCDREIYDDELKLTGVAGKDDLVYGNIVSKFFKTYESFHKILKEWEKYDFKTYYKDSKIVLVSDSKSFNNVEKLLKDNGFEVLESEKVSEVSLIGSNLTENFRKEIKNKLSDEGINFKMSLEEGKYISLVVDSYQYIKALNLLHENVTDQFEKLLSCTN